MGHAQKNLGLVGNTLMMGRRTFLALHPLMFEGQKQNLALGTSLTIAGSRIKVLQHFLQLGFVGAFPFMIDNL